MSHIYTLVAYRPNGVDYCRNCVMDASDSGFALHVCENAEDVARHWAKFRMDDLTNTNRAVCAWEVTLLIDGLDESTAWSVNDGATAHLYVEVSELTEQALAQLQAQQAERARIAKQLGERVQRERHAVEVRARESQERAEFVRLQKKYGA